MESQIVKPKARYEEVIFWLDFESPDGLDYRFECDVNGAVYLEKLSEEGLRNLGKCRSGELGGRNVHGPENRHDSL